MARSCSAGALCYPVPVDRSCKSSYHSIGVFDSTLLVEVFTHGKYNLEKKANYKYGEQKVAR